MSLFLYIDTSGLYSHVLLFNEETILSEKINKEENSHAKMLNTHMEEMLIEHNIKWNEIDAIMVMNGPGSYTGLRIGLASAKGFCFAMDIPLILVTQFDLMREVIIDEKEKNIFILKARENEFFVDFVQKNKGLNKVLNRKEILDLIEENNSYLVSTDTSLKNDFSNLKLIKINNHAIQNLGIKSFYRRTFTDILNAEPYYMKSVYFNKII